MHIHVLMHTCMQVFGLEELRERKVASMANRIQNFLGQFTQKQFVYDLQLSMLLSFIYIYISHHHSLMSVTQIFFSVCA